MVKGYKVMLLPNNKQNTKLFQYANTARFAYNWALAKQMEAFQNGDKFISNNDLRKEFTQMKKLPEFYWLRDISNNVSKQAIKDCCISYKKFFNKQKRTGIKYTKEKLAKLQRKGKKPTVYDMNGHPKFKSRKRSEPKFYQDNCKIEFSETHVKLEGLASSKKKNKQKLNWIKLAEKNRIPTNCKYVNPRISFDGLHWWVSVGIEISDCDENPINNGVGIDLGVKDLAICSDKSTYKNINKTGKVKKLKKKQRRLQRRISKKYLINNKGGSYYKTSNIIKSEKKLLKVIQRLTNIRHNYLHQTTSSIVNRKPMFIVLEDLNINGMMKNKHLSKAIQEQCLYEFYRQIEYKAYWNNIMFIEADRYFPSSKLCHECGYVKKDLKLSDRTYICPECGNKIDRDYQASLNLLAYGENVIQSAA